jgi:large subunit ribosomal protein L24
MTMGIRRDDTVRVTTGRDKGKEGKVRRVIPKEDRVVIEGVNVVKRHMKRRGIALQAGIIEREAPIHISNVMLICTKCGRPTRLGHRTLPSGQRARECRRCGEVIE